MLFSVEIGMKKDGGEKGIRTPERVNPLTVFETAAFDHSAISPNDNIHITWHHFLFFQVRK